MLRFSLAVILFQMAVVCSALAQTEKPELSAYGALPMISRADISPDGSKVATIANVDGVSYFLLYDASGKPLAKGEIDKLKARSVYFYNDNYVIVTVSETTTTYGFRGEYENSAAFVVNLETLDIQQLLVKTKRLFPAQSGLGRILGKGPKPDTVLMQAFMGGPGSTPSRDLLSVSLDNGRGRVTSRGSNDTIDWFSDGKGSPLIRESYNNKKNLYTIQHFDGDRWQTVYEEEDANVPPLSIRGITPDSTGVVFISTSKRTDGFDELMKMDFEGNVSGPLLAAEGREIDSIYTDAERRVLGVRYSGASPSYDFLDETIAAAYDAMSERLPNATLYLNSWSDDKTKFLYNVFEPSLGDIWLVQDVSTDTVKMIAKNRPSISSQHIGVVLAIEYKARDGLDIPAIVTLPPNSDMDANLPLIVLPHGGPRSYDRLDFDWMAQFFASRGYAVLQPNFRGSTGYGYEFEQAGHGEWGGKMQDDITDGVKALGAAGIADPDRACIVGASYGGYSALVGATLTPELYKCVIAIAPVSDLNRMLSDVKRESGRDHWVIDYWENLMVDGDARRNKLRSISPANFADKVQAPVLLLHGDDDTVVPYRQSQIMRNKLKSAGKDVKIVKLKGEDHWLSVAKTRMQLLEEMDKFVAEHLPVEG